MDTKLKRYNIWFKILAFILITVLSFYMMTILGNLYRTFSKLGYIEDIDKNHYTDTLEYSNTYCQLESSINTILQYKSEEAIRNGDYVLQSDIDDQTENLFLNKLENIRQSFYDSEYDITDDMLRKRFQQDYKTDIMNIEESIIQDQLSEFRNAIDSVKSVPNLQYYINVNKNIISNKDFNSITDSKYSYYETTLADDNKTVISQAGFSFDENYISNKNEEFLDAKHNTIYYGIQETICLVIFLLCLTYLIFAAGKKASDPQGIHHPYADKIYIEFTLFFLFLSVCGAAACGYALIGYTFNFAVLFTGFAASLLLSVALILMLVRHIKSRTFFKHTIIFTLFSFIFRSVKKIYDAGTPMIKALLFVSVLGLITAVPFVFIITLPLALVFTYIQVTKYIAVRDGVKDIKNGVYNQKIVINGTGEIAALASDINDISAGLRTEVERRLKSERLKTELIVNVSHDIKTPLTSVITYVDLLKKEDIQNDNAKKYIEVIAGKSGRLKTLIDDLFDASKAASGNIQVNFENVDISAIITQGLGELDDKIKSSSLNFKVNLPQTQVTAAADGGLLWRVLENLLSNVFKYSLENSRVYIDVSEDDQNAYIEIKNISAAELNIPEDEIMERFKRGDKSRSSEGSGLGLDIAKSLMLCQNGELVIKIDGDLFKSKLRIPKLFT